MACSSSRERRVAFVGLLILGAFATAARAERLPIKTYTTAEGLGSSVIIAIIPDSRGFLWFATHNGLSRFDGLEFRTYTTGEGLPHPVVNDLLETTDGEYWVATNGGGVCRFNVERGPATGGEPTPRPLFTCKNVGSHFQSNRVNFIHEDRRHRIWVGTDNGLFHLERGSAAWKLEPVAIEGLPATGFSASQVLEDSAGRLWIATSRGLLRIDPDGRAGLYTLRGRDPFTVTSIAEHEGAVWLGGRFGLLALHPDREIGAAGGLATRVLNPGRACFNSGDGAVSVPSTEGEACLSGADDGLPNTVVQALGRTRAERLWIATAGGLAYVEGARFRSLATAENLAGTNFSKLVEDLDGHLWMGTNTGAMKLTLEGLVSYGPGDGLGHPRIRALYEDRDGTILAVSGEWVINQFDGARFHVIRPRVPDGEAYGASSSGAFLDREGRWWLLTYRGVHRLKAGATVADAARQRSEAAFDVHTGLSAGRVIRLFEDSRGDIWIATISTEPRNVSRWRRSTGEIRQFETSSSAGPDHAVAFVEDRRGTVWIGLAGGGLARFSGDEYRLLGIADGIASEVTSLHVDRSGRLWVGSSAGLSRVEDVTADRPRLVRVTTAQGPSTSSVTCIADDEFGRIYLGTPRGIDRLDPATGLVKHFTTADGLAGDYVVTSLGDSRGALWFGTTEGVSRLVPSRDSPSAPPPVWIGEVRAGGTLRPLSELGETEIETLTLQPNENHVQISYFGIGFGAGGTLQYRYRLDGAERDWTGPTDRRVVHYASLAPGTYRFMVEAINADGAGSPRAAVVGFTVLRPIWQRWWFVSLAMLSGAAAGYSAHRYRVIRLVELERVRTRIAADLHDDIGGSLSRIAIQSEVARREIGEPSGLPARRLGEIADTARGVVDALGDVVWSVDPRQDDLGSVERRVREYADDVLSGRGVSWSFHGAGHLDRVPLDPQARRDLLLLLKEGVTNIARHSGARSASLRLDVTDGELQADLQDDGCGFDPSAEPSNGHGLTNMRARAARLGGRLDIESSPGAGTKLHLALPLRSRRRMNMRLLRRSR